MGRKRFIVELIVCVAIVCIISAVVIAEIYEIMEKLPVRNLL